MFLWFLSAGRGQTVKGCQCLSLPPPMVLAIHSVPKGLNGTQCPYSHYEWHFTHSYPIWQRCCNVAIIFARRDAFLNQPFTGECLSETVQNHTVGAPVRPRVDRSAKIRYLHLSGRVFVRTDCHAANVHTMSLNCSPRFMPVLRYCQIESNSHQYLRGNT